MHTDIEKETCASKQAMNNSARAYEPRGGNWSRIVEERSNYRVVCTHTHTDVRVSSALFLARSLCSTRAYISNGGGSGGMRIMRDARGRCVVRGRETVGVTRAVCSFSMTPGCAGFIICVGASEVWIYFSYI